jgi:hypothetical protein
MDSLVGNAGAKLDGSKFSGNFTHTLTVSKYDDLQLDVGADFTGSLSATLQGNLNHSESSINVVGSVAPTGSLTVNFPNPARYNAIAFTVGADFAGSFYGWLHGVPHPVSSMNVAGSVLSSAKIKVEYLDSISIGGNMSGTLKGFGDASTPTIGQITVGGDFLSPGLIEAPTFGNVSISHQFGGQLLETSPSQDFNELDVGSLLPSGVISAASGGTLNVADELAGVVTVAGSLGTLVVGSTLSGSVACGSIGSAFVGGNLTGQIVALGRLQSLTLLGASVGGISAGSADRVRVNPVRGANLLDIPQSSFDESLQQLDLVDLEEMLTELAALHVTKRSVFAV